MQEKREQEERSKERREEGRSPGKGWRAARRSVFISFDRRGSICSSWKI